MAALVTVSDWRMFPVLKLMALLHLSRVVVDEFSTL
jgi:hypothetical protein